MVADWYKLVDMNNLMKLFLVHEWSFKAVYQLLSVQLIHIGTKIQAVFELLEANCK